MLKSIRTKIKSYRFRIVITFLLIAVVMGGFFIASNYRKIVWSVPLLNPKTITIGVITDIHAGNQDRRTEGLESNNVLLPANFEKNLGSALSKMKNYDFILTLGDNLNTSSKKYTQRLLEMTQDYPMIWTKGNHDTDKMFRLFHQPHNYYYVDKGRWRIIVLDNGNIDHSVDYAKGDYIPRGYMEPEQVEWLKEALKTDKKIVVAMHVPVFDRFNTDSIYPNQQYLVKMFEDSGNVKYVLAGHFHIYNWHKNINGIDYYTVPSISLEGQEGYFMTLTLPNN